MINKLLIANRGEIAIRIARAAADLDVPTVAVFSEDDAGSLHAVRACEARQLEGRGPAAYMDAGQLIEIARSTGCDAVHPGYGFLSESGDFARRCAEAGLTFVGPRPEILDLLGDKAQARTLASTLEVPVLPGVNGAATLEQARSCLDSLPSGSAVAIKAVFGGGGRGMRIVSDRAQLEDAYERCRSEARAAFGSDDVYVEQLLPQARHIEMQVIGDGSGAVGHLGERECTIQRRHQKLIEIASQPLHLRGPPRAHHERSRAHGDRAPLRQPGHI
jgi:acetyl/propionyl-CoA carboxylase alpha subunit